MVHIRRLAPVDLSVLSNVAPGAFDNPINERSAKTFLADPNHFLVVAVLGDKKDPHPEVPVPDLIRDGPRRMAASAAPASILRGSRASALAPQDEGSNGLVVGFVSAVRMFHPDKEKPELFINEIGVAPEYRRRGIGKALIKAVIEEAKKAGCRLAWLAVDEDNKAALALYRSAGGKPPEKQIHIDFDLD